MNKYWYETGNNYQKTGGSIMAILTLEELKEANGQQVVTSMINDFGKTVGNSCELSSFNDLADEQIKFLKRAYTRLAAEQGTVGGIDTASNHKLVETLAANAVTVTKLSLLANGGLADMTSAWTSGNVAAYDIQVTSSPNEITNYFDVSGLGDVNTALEDDLSTALVTEGLMDQIDHEIHTSFGGAWSDNLTQATEGGQVINCNCYQQLVLGKLTITTQATEGGKIDAGGFIKDLPTVGGDTQYLNEMLSQASGTNNASYGYTTNYDSTNGIFKIRFGLRRLLHATLYPSMQIDLGDATILGVTQTVDDVSTFNKNHKNRIVGWIRETLIKQKTQ